MRLFALRWPLPALFTWLGGWSVFFGTQALGFSKAVAYVAALLIILCGSMLVQGFWRRALIFVGFPISLVLTGWDSHFSAAWWLGALCLFLVLYPLKAWSDAPLFPTPKQALRNLSQWITLKPGEKILDAGCGLGAGLRELHRAYPHCEVSGIEWSPLLALMCRMRCRFARVYHGDFWRHDWSEYQLVYVFQRPESMARCAEKAAAQMRPGSWLVSLEFPVPDLAPTACVQVQGRLGKPIWLYQNNEIPQTHSDRSLVIDP
jgi:SAM-dependent methyltransferase